MARRRGRGMTLGSWCALILTLLVGAGCLAALIGIRGSAGNVGLDAERLVSVLTGQTTLAPLFTATSATATVKTTLVTPSPAVAVTAVPTDSPAQTQAPQTHSFTLTVGGLIGFESDISASAKTDGAYDYAGILDGVSPAIHADLNIAFVNQIYNAVNKPGDISAPASALDAVSAAGFDFILPGGKNALDAGMEGVRATLSALSERGISSTGLYASAEDSEKLTLFSVNGAKIALLHYLEKLSDKGAKAVSGENCAYAIRLFSAERAIQDIAQAKAAGADYIIVSLYWGAQNATAPTSAQMDAVQTLADAGANLVISAGSEAVFAVANTLTMAEGAAKNTLTVYSMGTLLGQSREKRAAVSGMLLHLSIHCSAESGLAAVESVEYTPTYICRQQENNVWRYRVLISSLAPPDSMIDKQRENMARALKLIQDAMATGPAQQRSN